MQQPQLEVREAVSNLNASLGEATRAAAAVLLAASDDEGELTWRSALTFLALTTLGRGRRPCG